VRSHEVLEGWMDDFSNPFVLLKHHLKENIITECSQSDFHMEIRFFLWIYCQTCHPRPLSRKPKSGLWRQVVFVHRLICSLNQSSVGQILCGLYPQMVFVYRMPLSTDGLSLQVVIITDWTVVWYDVLWQITLQGHLE
jgi:hypothetical protein